MNQAARAIAPDNSQVVINTWGAFLGQHARQLLATDFFSVETAWLERLHLLFFLEIGSRRVHYAGCTRHPTAALARLRRGRGACARAVFKTSGGALSV